MNKRTYVGLDVHARSVKGCAIDRETGEILRQSLAANDAGVAEWVSGLPGPVLVVYEAGPTGFGLARLLAAVGIECLVAAPSELQRPSGDRVKTDARDAEHLARLALLGQISPVREWGLSRVRTTRRSSMSHADAILTPKGRLRLAQCVVDDGWPLRRAAERFQVSVTTAARWAARNRDRGEQGMVDRSSRPASSPQRTSLRRERRIIALRINRRWGPARIGYLLGIHPSTEHRVLSRFGLARLSWLDRATGRIIRRYEHARPGDLVHVDIEKLGRIPDGGGHRVTGRAMGNRNKTGTTANRRPGYAFLHNAVDDHSRLAYAEILADEKKDTAAGFRERANVYFESCGITVKRVLTDNGSCYRSYAFKDALGPDISHKRTRPYRPQTNGKVERYNRTMLDEWAYAKPYGSESERVTAFTDWLHHYNHHRGHTSLKGQPPASRVTNLSGQYS